jgi:hypothetical protein
MGPMGRRVHGSLTTTPDQNMDCWGELLDVHLPRPLARMSARSQGFVCK